MTKENNANLDDVLHLKIRLSELNCKLDLLKQKVKKQKKDVKQQKV